MCEGARNRSLGRKSQCKQACGTISARHVKSQLAVEILIFLLNVTAVTEERKKFVNEWSSKNCISRSPPTVASMFAFLPVLATSSARSWVNPKLYVNLRLFFQVLCIRYSFTAICLVKVKKRDASIKR